MSRRRKVGNFLEINFAWGWVAREGDTFSTFTKWEEFTVDEHLSSIQDLLERARQQHASE